MWNEKLVNEANSLTRYVLAAICLEISAELASYLAWQERKH